MSTLNLLSSSLRRMVQIRFPNQDLTFEKSRSEEHIYKVIMYLLMAFIRTNFYINKIKMINRCDLMLQDLKHFKTVIMSSYKTFQSVTKCHKVASYYPFLMSS